MIRNPYEAFTYLFGRNIFIHFSFSLSVDNLKLAAWEISDLSVSLGLGLFIFLKFVSRSAFRQHYKSPTKNNQMAHANQLISGNFCSLSVI